MVTVLIEELQLVELPNFLEKNEVWDDGFLQFGQEKGDSEEIGKFVQKGY